MSSSLDEFSRRDYKGLNLNYLKMIDLINKPILTIAPTEINKDPESRMDIRCSGGKFEKLKPTLNLIIIRNNPLKRLSLVVLCNIV